MVCVGLKALTSVQPIVPMDSAVCTKNQEAANKGC